MIESDKWKELWSKNIKFTACYLVRENLMKTYCRWYLTPVKSAIINKSYKNKCWRCKEHVGTHYHMSWSCPVIQKLWNMIYEETKRLIEITFSKKPDEFLLGIVPNNIPKNKFRYLCMRRQHQGLLWQNIGKMYMHLLKKNG